MYMWRWACRELLRRRKRMACVWRPGQHHREKSNKKRTNGKVILSRWCELLMNYCASTALCLPYSVSRQYIRLQWRRMLGVCVLFYIRGRGILYTNNTVAPYIYGSSCRLYTVAVPRCCVWDRLMSSAFMFDRLLVNEELKWAALLPRFGRDFWATDVTPEFPVSAQFNFSDSIISAKLLHVWCIAGRTDQNLARRLHQWESIKFIRFYNQRSV
jgi:hypothetical protein